MAFSDGRKSGGRKKGALNKRTLEVRERLEQLGLDPIEGLVAIAQDVVNPVDVRLRAMSELAGYVYAKRRAVEHSATGQSVRFEINLGESREQEEERVRLAAEATARLKAA